VQCAFQRGDCRREEREEKEKREEGRREEGIALQHKRTNVMAKALYV